MASKKTKNANNNKSQKEKKIDNIEKNLKIAEISEIEEKEVKKIQENKVVDKSNEKLSQPQNKVKKAAEKTSKIETIQTKEDVKKENINKEIKNDINIEEEQKALIEKRDMESKKKTYIAINVFLIIILILLFSTVFAITNMNNVNIVKGVSVKGIDISNLSVEEAKTKVTEAINIELLPEIKLKHNDFEITLKPSNIEYSYKLDKVIEDAYKIGRDGDILKNNYKLLFTAFLGEDIKLERQYNEEILNSTIDNIASTIPGVVVNPSYYIENNELIINRGIAGIKVDKEKLKKDILNTIENRNASEILLENKIVDVLEIPVESAEPEEINIDKIYSEIYKEPQDAYFIEEPFQIIAESDGIDLEKSLDEVKADISIEKKDEYRFALKISKPEKTIKDLGAEAFPYTISKFSTRYDASNIDRSNNLKISANKINGTVLMPGESFSFNKVVGKRTIEDGYRNAKIYQNGQVVDGLAGGICQVSSTLYNAVLMANLQINERRNHSFKTSYLAAGKDATVVYGVKDLKFTNSRTYPIKINVTVENGVIEFSVNGIQEEQEYEIKILPVITQTIPYATEEIIDSTLAPGSRVVVQKGSSGCKVTTYKETRLNGTVVSKEIISNDTYSALKSIVRVGP